MHEEHDNRRRRRRSRRRSGGKGPGGPRPDGKGPGGPRTDVAPGPQARSDGDGGGGGGGNGGWRGRGNGRGKGRGRARGRTARGRPRPRHTRPAENWWARRWIEVLEGFDVGRRLGRGRSYARQGQVVELDVGKGFVTALVQGSRDAPYLVRMRLSMLSSTDWKKVTRRISEDPELTAALLSGQIPENIEAVFEPLGLSLFPSASGDLKTACSCPDQANPCKHVAAVYYLLADEFDRDPFLVFRLRGIDRGEMLEAIGGSAALRGAPVPAPQRPERPEPSSEPQAQSHGQAQAQAQSRSQAESQARSQDEASSEAEAEAADAEPPEPARRVERPPEPLPLDPHAFFAGEGAIANGGEVRIPALPGALIRRLGGFPFFRGSEDCEAVVMRVLRNGSIAGLDVFLGERESE